MLATRALKSLRDSGKFGSMRASLFRESSTRAKLIVFEFVSTAITRFMFLTRYLLCYWAFRVR